jgi:hypothetical protein
VSDRSKALLHPIQSHIKGFFPVVFLFSLVLFSTVAGSIFIRVVTKAGALGASGAFLSYGFIFLFIFLPYLFVYFAAVQ